MHLVRDQELVGMVPATGSNLTKVSRIPARIAGSSYRWIDGAKVEGAKGQIRYGGTPAVVCQTRR